MDSGWRMAAWKAQAVSQLLRVGLVTMMCDRKRSKEMCGVPGSVRREPIVCGAMVIQRFG